jgi:hypothetical protein
MARNRVIYQSEAIFAAPATTTGTLTIASNSIRRVQSCNYNFSIARQDVNQFGELAAIDRLILQEPTVSVDMSYYFEPTGFNEANLGLRRDAVTGTSSTPDHMLEYIISSGAAYNEKNIYILTSDAGIDANDTGANGMGNSANYNGIIGIGNCFMTNWSLEAAVGAIPTVSCSFEGQNIVFTGGITAPTVPNPRVNDGSDPLEFVTLPSGAGLFDSSVEVSAVRPGDVTLLLGSSSTDNVPSVGLDESDLKIQSVTVAMAINREPIRKLGKLFAFTREITFPVTCTMSVSAIIGDAGNKKLFDLINGVGDCNEYNLQLTLNGYVGCSNTPKTAYIILKGAKLDSQNITSSIGPNKSVTMEFSAQIGKNSGLHFRSAT